MVEWWTVAGLLEGLGAFQSDDIGYRNTSRVYLLRVVDSFDYLLSQIYTYINIAKRLVF